MKVKNYISIFLILFLFNSFNSWSTTYTWTGAIDGNWETDGNWDNSGYPNTSGDNVIFNAGSINCVVNEDISLGSGTFTINGYSGTISFSGDYAFACGNVTVTSGTLDFSGTTSLINTTAVTVNGGSFIACAGPTYNGTGLFTLSSGLADFSNTTSATLNGLVISGGTFTSAASTLTCVGDATLSGGGVFAHNSGTFTIQTSSSARTITGAFVFHELVFNFNSGSINQTRAVDLANNLTVEHNLKFNFSGGGNNKVLNFGGAYTIDLTDDGSLGGSVTVTASGGSISAINITPTINFNSNLSQTVSFYPTQNLKYGDLRFNNTHTNGASLGAAITATNVTGSVTVESGTFTNNSSNGYAIAGNGAETFEVDNGATVKLYNTSAFPTGFGTTTLNSGSTIEYAGLGQTISNSPTYHHLVLSSSSGSNAKTLAAATVVNGNLTIGANTTLNAAGFQLTLGGNFDNSGTYTHGSNTIVFDGNTTVSGSATTTFNNITINSTKTLVAPSGTMNVAGNFANNGTFTHNSGTVDFTGSTTVSGSATSTFSTVTITGTLIGHTGTMNVAANFTNNGTFTHNSGTVGFTGTSSILGSSTTSFSGVTVNGTLTAPSGTMNVAGNFANNGTFTHNSGTVVFNGTSVLSGISTSSFANVTVSGTLTGPSASVNIAGNFTNNGTYTHNSGTVVFNGTTSVGGSNTTTFSNITISGVLTAPSGTMNVAGNFVNNGTFTHNSGTIGFTGTTTISGSSSNTFAHITITGTLTAPAANVDIVRNFINNGTYNSGTGTLTFNGSVAQTISGSGASNFANLTIDNASGVSLSSTSISVTDNLTVTNGTFAAGANLVTLTSSSSKTARIAPVLGAITGTNFEVERHLAAGDGSLTWANLSSPITGSTVQDWANELTFSYLHSPPNSVSNILTYTESDSSYHAVTAATTLTSGKGFEVYFVDDASGNTWTGEDSFNSIGTPNTGDQLITLTYTAAMGAWAGQNLVGNPFASAISLTGVTFTNASSTVDVYDDATNNYASLSGASLIAPHQGFWAYANVGGGSITIHESDKSTDLTTDVRVGEVNTPYLQLTLSSADGSHKMAHTLKVAADENALDGWDSQDHPYRKSPVKTAPSITASSERLPLSISTFNSNNQIFNMPINTKVGIAGKYQITAKGLEFINDDYICVILEDKKLGKTVDLNKVHYYTFFSGVNDDANRFVLHFSKQGNCKSTVEIPSALNTSTHIIQTQAGVTINFNFAEAVASVISVTNVLGQEIVAPLSLDATTQSVEMDVPSDFHGVYIVKIATPNGAIVNRYVKP